MTRRCTTGSRAGSAGIRAGRRERLLPDDAEQVGAGPDRYPHVEAGQIRTAAPDLVLLPDEPYPFSASDGPEEFPAQRVVLLPGRLLTWYGPSLATARADLLRVIG